MSPLRIIGYVGLALLTVIVLLSIYLSFGKSDWRGIGIGLGALALFAFLGNNLWISGLKQKRPYVTAVPNQRILGLFLCVLGVSAGLASVERFMSGSWLSAVIALVMAVSLFDGAYRALRRRT